MSPVISLTLRIWRQADPGGVGGFETHRMEGISTDLSLLEALDQLNERLIAAGRRPVGFEHDCREGICGSCGFLVNGQAHGPRPATTVCQLYLREFADGTTLTLEPFRARAFPPLQDLSVDRSSLDRIIEAGGYISVNSGAAPEANLTPVPKTVADAAMDAAACIGCGACVAACPNSAGQLFTAAKVQHLNLLPQGQAERWKRVEAMVETMEEYFGSCTNHGECREACPKEISLDFIAYMNKDYVKSKIKNRRLASQQG